METYCLTGSFRMLELPLYNDKEAQERLGRKWGFFVPALAVEG